MIIKNNLKLKMNIKRNAGHEISNLSKTKLCVYFLSVFIFFSLVRDVRFK